MMIIIILMILTTVFTYLLIVGANMNKTEQERKDELEEEANYYKDYEDGGR